jgi:MSHA biogenesis protein MshO
MINNSPKASSSRSYAFKIGINRCKKPFQSNKGFTLIELIIVIVLLGILSVGISGFLKLGTEMFVDVKNRSEIVATARFAMERLNRELRSALPNSVMAIPTTGFDSSEIQCIQYIPIETTAHYLDIPTSDANEPQSNTLSVIEFDLNSLVFDGSNNIQIAVYPLNNNDVYSATQNKLRLLEDATIDQSNAVGNSKQWDLNFDNNILFEEDSPTERLYFINDKVSYCVRRTELKRFVGDNPLDNANPVTFFDSDNNGVLMATNLLFDASQNEYPFRVSEATQLRNSTVLIKLIFSRNEEFFVFNNEVHIPNAP